MENSYMLNGEVGDSMRLVNEFAQFLKDHGKSDNTVKTYSRNINLYVKWEISQTSEPFDGFITEISAENYLKELEDHVDPKGKHLSLTTIKAKMTAISIFNEFLHCEYGFPRIQIPTKKGVIEPEVKVLERNELNKMIRWLEKSGTLLQNAVIRTLLNTGIRCSELVNLEIYDYEVTDAREKGALIIRSGKGNKYRKIPLNKKCITAIDKYIAIRPYSNDNYLFIGQRGHLTRNGIYDLVSTVGIKSLGKSINPHQLRHTCFTNIAKNTDNPTDIKTISALAGHGNINTTSKYYINSSWEDKVSAISNNSY